MDGFWLTFFEWVVLVVIVLGRRTKAAGHGLAVGWTSEARARRRSGPPHEPALAQDKAIRTS